MVGYKVPAIDWRIITDVTGIAPEDLQEA